MLAKVVIFFGLRPGAPSTALCYPGNYAIVVFILTKKKKYIKRVWYCLLACKNIGPVRPPTCQKRLYAESDCLKREKWCPCSRFPSSFWRGARHVCRPLGDSHCTISSAASPATHVAPSSAHPVSQAARTNYMDRVGGSPPPPAIVTTSNVTTAGDAICCKINDSCAEVVVWRTRPGEEPHV